MPVIMRPGPHPLLYMPSMEQHTHACRPALQFRPFGNIMGYRVFSTATTPFGATEADSLLQPCSAAILNQDARMMRSQPCTTRHSMMHACLSIPSACSLPEAGLSGGCTHGHPGPQQPND